MVEILKTAGSRPRTIVTGGAGFLGSHLCDRLIGEGHEVLCLDNLLTGRTENIQHLWDHPRFAFVLHDVTNPISLDELIRKAAPKLNGNSDPSPGRLDYILHFASPASPRDYMRHPIHTLKLGGLGAYHVLGMAKRYGSVALFASTSEVYGDPDVCPQKETYWGRVNPIGPRSVYDEAKRFSEAMAMAYAREHKVAVRIARIFNTYGERMRADDGRALPTFMSEALRNEPVTVYGDGTQTRSFCYVDDLVDGLYRLLVSDQMGPVNFGNPDEITLLALAKALIGQTASRSNIVFEPLPVDDPTRRRPDITRACLALKWQPRVGLREGIERIIPYFKSQLAAPSSPPAHLSTEQGDLVSS